MTGLGKRVKDLKEDNPVLVVIGCVVAACAAILTLIAFYSVVLAPAYNHFWGHDRPERVAAIEDLRLAQSRSFVRSLLGEPFATDRFDTDLGAIRLDSFDVEAYVVTTASVVDDGQVVGLAVATCESDPPALSLGTPYGLVDLGTTRMSDVEATPTDVEYSQGGTAGGQVVLDHYYGDVHVRDWTSLYWGQFYRCLPDGMTPFDRLPDQPASLGMWAPEQYTSDLDRFRSATPITAVGLVNYQYEAAVAGSLMWSAEIALRRAP